MLRTLDIQELEIQNGNCSPAIPWNKILWLSSNQAQGE